MCPDVRIINLETSVTVSDSPWSDKRIHYRMNPANIACLTAAAVDCCVLANNHVLDWDYSGLAETLATLRRARLRTAGAGGNQHEAAAPAVIEVAGKGRVLVFAFGCEDSGVPAAWGAGENQPGVNLLPGLSKTSARRAARFIQDFKRTGDIVVASIHWGGNYGCEIPRSQREFAHALIAAGAVDIIHGHSSHHPKGIEVYKERPILYGCGDFINDYEGLALSRMSRMLRRLFGRKNYRIDLALMYFITMDESDGGLKNLEMTPLEIKRFSLHRAGSRNINRLKNMLDRESATLGTRVELVRDNRLVLRWNRS
jgi:poly-gamma-glutamate synthesis protein (capsule biosynthesis protein)